MEWSKNQRPLSFNLLTNFLSEQGKKEYITCIFIFETVDALPRNLCIYFPHFECNRQTHPFFYINNVIAVGITIVYSAGSWLPCRASDLLPPETASEAFRSENDISSHVSFPPIIPCKLKCMMATLDILNLCILATFLSPLSSQAATYSTGEKVLPRSLYFCLLEATA